MCLPKASSAQKARCSKVNVLNYSDKVKILDMLKSVFLVEVGWCYGKMNQVFEMKSVKSDLIFGEQS
jgi:hypothetical protein